MVNRDDLTAGDGTGNQDNCKGLTNVPIYYFATS
jgi:hypothetical protein